MPAVVDKFLDFMRMGSDTDVDDDEEYAGEDIEERGSSRSSRKARSSRFDDDDDDYDDRRSSSNFDDDDESSSFAGRTSLWGKKNNTASSPKTTQETSKAPKKFNLADPGMEVRVFKPTNLDEARKVTDTLLTKQSAILNLEGLDIMMAQRIIDFVGGSNYALHGHFTRISSYIFLFTPADVDIAGDIAEETIANAQKSGASPVIAGTTL